MAELSAALGAALAHVLDASHLAGPDQLPELVAEAGGMLGAVDTLVLVVDYDQVMLVPLTSADGARGAPLLIDATLAGRAFRDMSVVGSSAGSGQVLFVPLLDGTERLGVLQLTFPDDRQVDDALRGECTTFASVVAELMISRALYGDSIERARRRLPMTVPAELQWRQLPPLSFATPRVSISGILVPANEVAGDSFDYAVVDDVAHLSIVDAMGHGLEATLLSIVAIGALRNARRTGLDLAHRVRSADKHLAVQFGPDKFVTAIVGELDLNTGMWRWVTAGHPPALVVREGKVVKTLDLPVDPPLGLLPGQPSVGEERLQPADRLLLHSDGVIEARNRDGEFFGSERLVDFVAREAAAGRPAPETLRRLTHAIVDYHDGELQDDATTLVVEWLGDEPDRMMP